MAQVSCSPPSIEKAKSASSTQSGSRVGLAVVFEDTASRVGTCPSDEGAGAGSSPPPLSDEATMGSASQFEQVSRQ